MITNRLPQLISQKGISIRQLSEQTGVTYSTIWAMVQGQRRSVQLEVLDAVCAVLNVQPGDIYQRSTTNEESRTIANKIEAVPSEAGVKGHARPVTRRATGNEWRSW